MNFAIDFDGCADGDILLFRLMIEAMRASNHDVYIVTMRYPSVCGFVVECFNDIVNAIIPTSRMAKKKTTENLGVNIDVWMDDNPNAIYLDAMQIWGQSSPEGSVVVIDHYKQTQTVVQTPKLENLGFDVSKFLC